MAVWTAHPSTPISSVQAYVLESPGYGRIIVRSPTRFLTHVEPHPTDPITYPAINSSHAWYGAWLYRFEWEYPHTGLRQGNFGSYNDIGTNDAPGSGIWYMGHRLTYPHDQAAGLAYMKSLVETGHPP